MKIYKRLCYLLALVACINAHAQHSLVVKVNEPKGDIQKTMWGIFFEDINMGADGGIYAELVKNRSFEFYRPLMGWKVNQKNFREGAVLVMNRKANDSANPRFIRVTAAGGSKGDFGMTNEGFRGMGIKKDLRYDFSVQYRQVNPGIKMHVELVDSTGMVLGGTTVATDAPDTNWHKATASFTANATVMRAKMNLWFEGSGVIDLDMVSLFPSDTWKNRPGGLRADMVQKLADLKPGFIRFPGGCIVEGFDLSQRYQWKKTVGPVEQRQLIINRWNTEFTDRLTPDYYQTFGLGFFEYFQLAEDIGAEALPILNCGMACQFNSCELVPLDQLGPYVQDALDLIEFANGDVSTKWGKLRADMGHPAPFRLKMMGIGNENWGPQYVERLKIFTKAIKEKYPDFKLVNSSGTDPNGQRFDFLNTELRHMNADLIDEHYYRPPSWFFSNAKRYDTFPRNASKIFAGEYASHYSWDIDGTLRNNWIAALSEAAYMTGLERNADVVSMASYAPLFAHVDGWQWSPDLIWVNNLQSYGTPNYYVQQLFSVNKGNKILPITMNNMVIAGQDSLYATACFDTATNEIIVKLVNASANAQVGSINLAGVKKLAKEGSLTVLKSEDLLTANSFDQPQKVAPQQSAIPVKGKDIVLNAAPYSLNIVRVKMEK